MSSVLSQPDFAESEAKAQTGAISKHEKKNSQDRIASGLEKLYHGWRLNRANGRSLGNL